MERYDGSEHRNTETYLIQGTESNPYLTIPPLEQVETMGNEGVPDFIVDQGLYYPTATNYGYYCTGFELPSEWDDHQRFFGLDGPDLQYAGMQTESLPYVYYTPSYGYAQSPYNPYNPYIPGAIVGVDGPFIGTQQYYTGPTYQNPISSPPYYPVVVQSRLDTNQNYSPDSSSLNSGVSNANRTGGPGLKNNSSSASAGKTIVSPKLGSGHLRARPAESAINQTHPLAKISEGSKTNSALSKQPVIHARVTSGGNIHSSSPNLTESRNAPGSIQVTDRVSPFRNSLKLSRPFTGGLSEFGSDARGWPTADKIRPRLQHGGGLNNGNGNSDVLGEQNRGPRTSRSKDQWPPLISVKAYTTKAGNTDAQGNIVIRTSQYNKEDFLVDYAEAKFFVIKSYSEDDVHKSIKYGVWSSTPNGNRRLDSAYEDAQRIGAGRPKGCPVFLFFSVNASGQFCGVAEMVGPVDFDKNMDFWQQDKWSGCFPVKWHIIKDVPNTHFRHIILENNENKPVTNSRDTQEIRYGQGLEMLSIFKNYVLKTSIIDDFIYYEDRQRIMQEEKAKLFSGSNNNSFFMPVSVPPSKRVGLTDPPTLADEKCTKHSDLNSSENSEAYCNEHVHLKPGSAISSSGTDGNAQLCDEDSKNDSSILKIGSLTIAPKQVEAKASTTVAVEATTSVNTEPVGVVTVGTLPVKVNGFGESSSRFLRVGTIPLGPKALNLDKADFSTDAQL